ncbi:hypothetical protein F5146DRAFT_871242, partial [Armillaria mellea]
KLQEVPSIIVASAALKDLHDTLYPPREKGKGHKIVDLDPFKRIWMEGMQSLLALCMDPRSMTYGKWAASSLQAAVTLLHGTYCAWILRKLVCNYISDCTILPLNPYGNWNQTMLVNEDLAQDINLYLQELGKDITAAKVVLFLAHPDIKEKHGITKKISLRMAQRYLHALGYHWQEAKKGQYVDGHERADVVWDCDKVFIPKIKELQHRMQIFDKDRKPIDGVCPDGKHIVLWFHDKSIFYAHDRRRKSWYHIAEPAKPYRKGEGASLMNADFFSADFGWLQSADGKRSA